MNRKRTTLAFSVLLLLAGMIPAVAQEKAKEHLPQSMIRKIEFRDSIKKKLRLVGESYQSRMQAILSDQQLDGKQKWEQLNALSRERNGSLRQISDEVKVRNTPQPVRQ